jgi:pyrimidine-specific ribonucleoside hydrolase
MTKENIIRQHKHPRKGRYHTLLMVALSGVGAVWLTKKFGWIYLLQRKAMKTMSQFRYLTLIFSIFLLAPAIANGQGKMPVWIDTDPACGLRATDDVDDCWAILYAIKSRKLEIVGLSTVYGNVSINDAHRTANSFLERIASEGMEVPNIYRGAGSEINGEVADNAATTALYNVLRKRKLTILALGPLTNIAKLIRAHPDIARNITGIIAIAGNRPDQRRFFIGNSKIMHFHDLNFRKDPKAFDVILKSKVPLTLLPFEVATKVIVAPDDLKRMGNNGESAKWLSANSRGWIDFWIKQFETEGFYPFDCLAVGYQIMPHEFQCEDIPAQIKWRRSRFVNRSELQVSHDLETDTRVSYCYDVSEAFKKSLQVLQPY